MEKIKPKEQLFCYYYAKLRSAKEAALKAGFPAFSAERQGDRLLMKKSILAEIEKHGLETQSDELMQTIISGLKRLAFSTTNDSVRLMVSSSDELKKTLDELDLFHVAEIKMPKENSVEIKFFDRFKAFDKLIDLVQTQMGQKSACDFYGALEQSVLMQTGIGAQDEV